LGKTPPMGPGVGGPPRFGAGDPGSTLFGVPGGFDDEDSMLADLGELLDPGLEPSQASVPPPPPPFRFAPPPSPTPAPRVSPPPPPPANPSRHNELDLVFEQAESDALELDLPDDDAGFDLPMPAAASPARAPRGPGGMSLPPPPGELDLPGPTAAGRRPPPPPPGAAELRNPGGPARSPMGLPPPPSRFNDLPQPANSTSASTMDLPPPPSRFADLPRPASSGSSFDLPPPPAPFSNLPTPAGPSPHGLDLPPPPGAAPPPRVPATRARPHDLPVPLDLDLPQPRLDLPQPRHDLPRPAQGYGYGNLPQPRQDLLRPVDGNGNLLQPHEQRLEPAEQRLQPASQELQSKDQFLTPAEQNLTPAQRAAAGLATRGGPGAAASHAGAAASAVRGPRTPQPRAIPEARGKFRGLALTSAGLLVVLGGAGGLYYSGLLDGERGDGQRGAPALKGKDTKAPVDAARSDRSPEVLAQIRRDEAIGYREAIKLAAAEGDAVGQAEAALLLHFRYGPDGVSAGQGRELLSSAKEKSAPAVRRVLGLDALTKGDLAAAEAALQGDDARTRLYRGFLRLAQGNYDAAREEAEAALASNGDDAAALAVRHAANLELDPKNELALLLQSVTTRPKSGVLRMLAAEATLEQGQLAKAEALASGFEEDEALAPGYRARVKGLQARVAIAQGDTATASQRLEEALELDKQNLALALLRVELLRNTAPLTEASLAAKAVAEAHPKSLEAAQLVAEVDLASGKGDEALAQLVKLAAAHPKAAGIPLLEGKVHAMRLAVEDGEKAFARALELDPTLTEAVIAHARMLANARQVEPGLALLDARLPSETMPKAKVALLLAKAELQEAALDLPGVLKTLDAADAIDPQNNAVQTRRGVARLRGGDFTGGRQDLAAVYERTGGYPGMTAPFGRILSREGDIERLEKLVGDRAEDPRADIELKLVGTRLRLLQGNSEAAKQLAQEVLLKEPSNWEAHMLLADGFRQSRDYPEALERIKMVQPPEPQAEYYLLKGKILEFNGRYAEARPEYQRALAVDPSLSEARFLYGRSLAYAGAGKAAVDELSRVIRETGDHYPAAYAAMGRAQKELGDYGQAVASLSKAVELDPAQYEAWYHKGTVHAHKNQHKLAAEALEHAVADEASSNDWYLDAWVRLGRAKFHLGDATGARQALERYLAIAPPNHASRGAAERLLRDLG